MQPKNYTNHPNCKCSLDRCAAPTSAIRSGDYDALIAHAIDMKDPQWAYKLNAKKMKLRQAEGAAMMDLGLV